MSKQWIQLPNGNRFFPLQAKGPIHLADVAKSLSLKYRFQGFTRTPYSVAQHSINVSRVLPEPLKLWGILHDVAEYVLGDVPTPIKRHWSMFRYRWAENRILKRIAKDLDLPWPMPEEVKIADTRLLATEVQWLFDSVHPEWAEWLAGVDTYVVSPSWFDYAHPNYYAELFTEHVTYLMENRHG